jgi:hypothetical protein
MLRTSLRFLTAGTTLLRLAPKASGVGRGSETPAHACGWQDSGMRRWPAGQQLNYGGRSGQHARVCAGTTVEEKSRSIVCGTQESDWTAPPAEIKVCSGQFFLAAAAARTSSDSCGFSANRRHRFCQLPRSRTEKRRTRRGHTRNRNDVLLTHFFNTYRRYHSNRSRFF